MRDYGFGQGKWVFIDWLGIELRVMMESDSIPTGRRVNA